MTTTENCLRATGHDRADTTWQSTVTLVVGLALAIEGSFGLLYYMNSNSGMLIGIITMLSVAMGVGLLVARPMLNLHFAFKAYDKAWRTTFRRLNPKADIAAIDQVVAHMKAHTDYIDIDFEKVSGIVERVTRFEETPTQALWVEVMQNYHHFLDGSQELATTHCSKK